MKKNTANKILDTATFLFATLEFGNVTIKQLAKAATANRAAISYYFGGKENLYHEVLRNQFSPALQALREVEISFRLTASERLLAYVKVLADIKHIQPYLTSLWHYEMNRHDASPNSFVVKEYTVQLYQYILSALCYGISQKEFLPDLKPYHAASVLLEMMHAPYVPVSLLTEPALSGKNAGKDYSVQAARQYLQGIRCVSL